MPKSPDESRIIPLDEVPDNMFKMGAASLRAGLPNASTAYFEKKGYVHAFRTENGHRRFSPDTVRRLAILFQAGEVGFKLEDVDDYFTELPVEPPTQEEWDALADKLKADVEERIAALELFRDRIHGCIGCGCMIFEQCHQDNPDDWVNDKGFGPRFLMGDEPGKPD